MQTTVFYFSDQCIVVEDKVEFVWDGQQESKKNWMYYCSWSESTESAMGLKRINLRVSGQASQIRWGLEVILWTLFERHAFSRDRQGRRTTLRSRRVTPRKSCTITRVTSSRAGRHPGLILSDLKLSYNPAQICHMSCLLEICDISSERRWPWHCK